MDGRTILDLAEDLQLRRSRVMGAWRIELSGFTDTMRERKGLMDAHATAFLTLAGGLGTCEELFETWSARVLGLHDKPVVLLDPDGHYTGLLSWIGGVVGAGFARAEALELLVVAGTVDEALDACLS